MCRSKAEGGLGVRALAVHNDCLLLKLLHQLHFAPPSRWASWVWSQLGGRSLLAPGRSPLDGEHWRALKDLMPTYRALTHVRVGDGRMTSFWHDWWLPCGPLGGAFPALFTHAVCPEVTVWEARHRGVRALLVPRLTPIAARDCASVQRLVDECMRSALSDTRLAALCSAPKGKFSARAAYALVRFAGVEAPNAGFLWASPTPSRVKFFGWLLALARIHTRDVLLRKTILTAAEAGCPCCTAELETADHLIFACPFAV